MPARASSGCQLNSPTGAVHHVIYLQFDNVHFRRDNPNVPSDLEQMPHLLNFIKHYGTLLTNHHTPLISHTANDILTSLTGMYSDRVGQPVANSFDYYTPSGAPDYTSSFKYWTDPVSSTDTSYNLITDPQGDNTPAPWVPYTRAGCDVGAFGTANIELENVSSDVNTVFGPNSPEAQEAAANHTKAVADFEGISIHCAKTSSVCSQANGGVADKLPSEPGGYNGYNALFGAKFVNPYLTNGGTTVKDMFGQPVTDGNGNPGFPGFDPSAAQSLGYVAAMQEHGIPVTYAYIADAHDNHGSSGGTYGPGEAGYVAQLKSYDRAFAKFFRNLRRHGINQSNTLFVITADENDHFVGGPPSPAGCDGIHTPCTYSKIGEIDANMTALLQSDFGITTPFDIHFDSAPVFYLNNQPAQNDQTITRPFERAVARLKVPNPITGQTVKAAQYLADQAEMRLLHMITYDPLRDPTFTMFGNPDYYWQTYQADCASTPTQVCEEGHAGFAWNHGDIQKDIVNTFLGMVGPGVKHLGIDHMVWTDHTDIRPTMMALLGLKDNYVQDGRVITEILTRSALNRAERRDGALLHKLGAWYKQIEAPVGLLAMNTLRASTRAMASGTAKDDSRYQAFEAEIKELTLFRNALGSEIRAGLHRVEFENQRIPRPELHLWIEFSRLLIGFSNLMAHQ